MTKAGPLEALIESVAALWIAVCTGYAISLAWPAFGLTEPLPAILGGSAVSALFVRHMLWRMRRRQVTLQRFDLPEIEPVNVVVINGAADELLLTPDMEQLRVELQLVQEHILGSSRICDGADELLLEDELPSPELQSRVVQLFEPARMPTAGELKSQIDRHLEEGRSEAPADATQELHDALAKLRRSLG